MARIINVLRIQGPPERVMEVWERIKDPHAGLRMTAGCGENVFMKCRISLIKL